MTTSHLGRALTVAMLCVLFAVAFAGCSSDDNGDNDATPIATSTAPRTQPATAATAAATQPAQSTPAQGGQEQVIGIVGVVNSGTRTIQITRLSGAEVTSIVITPATAIVTPSGATLALSDVRPSDRIIARGSVERGELAADRVEVQAAVPGASPGG